uniref:Microtubule affinity regulating kinase 1 n=1 Tax=Homo sapiens TaxID=9606 RepID=A0A7I2V624_HUMAN
MSARTPLPTVNERDTENQRSGQHGLTPQKSFYKGTRSMRILNPFNLVTYICGWIY